MDGRKDGRTYGWIEYVDPSGREDKGVVVRCSLAGTVGSNPPGAWLSASCECCVLSGRGLCDELITHPKECYRVWCD
jgi:hypothetical protein